MELHKQLRSISMFLLAVLCLLSSCHVAVVASLIEDQVDLDHDHDMQALVSFKSQISHDPWGALSSWQQNNKSNSFCQWYGVTCRNHGSGLLRVIALDLVALGLVGSLSPAIANLTFLQRLHLSGNYLRGPLPSELGLLTHLLHINLDDNPLGGVIPPSIFQNSTNLRRLILNNCNLSGTIPSNISNCKELRAIGLADNELDGGIPSELGFLSKLSELSVSRNSLSGAIPSSFWNLSSLSFLSLQNNSLSGTLPRNLGELLPRLNRLFMNNNLFYGPLPTSLSNASQLSMIQLNTNGFSGFIPNDWGRLKSLSQVRLFQNPLEAADAASWSFLSSLTNCTNLTHLVLGNNKFSGILPRSISNLSRTLQVLSMNDNQISGSIPRDIGNLENLNTLYMSSNLFSGDIPYSIGKLSNLQELVLGDNNFTGNIPKSLGNLSKLLLLGLYANNLRGHIPLSLSNCTFLMTLDFSFNNLNGNIPEEIISISSLTWYVDFSHNSLTGPLPLQVGSLKNIQSIDMSSNKLSGEIPGTLSGCQVLQFLLLQENEFEGSIPSSLSCLKGLQYLDLSNNSLSGTIPDLPGSFPNLTYLNLSYNKLEGEVPKSRFFENTSEFSVDGNPKLCGGVIQLKLPSCSSNRASKKKHFSTRRLIIISSASGALLLVLLISLYISSRWLKMFEIDLPKSKSITDKLRRVSYAELLEATDGFSEENLIGMGSFGLIYKGSIDDFDNERVVVAVKVLNLHQPGASRSFKAECEALRNVRHRNLVRILTACASIDFKGNDFKALVYDFLPNGSLDEWIHPKIDMANYNLRFLSLVQRLNIAVDVATALDYLHRYGPATIVHCDLKPANVLLDADMVAHVGDFGLAKFFATSIGISQSSSSSILKGSIGYIAPEYGIANIVSPEGDIYSYGILVLEMFTGKRPTHEDFKDGLGLHQYVALALLDQVTDVLDPNLKIEEEEDLLIEKDLRGTYCSFKESVMACIVSVLKIGITCSNEIPASRMHLEDAIKGLCKTRDEYSKIAWH